MRVFHAPPVDAGIRFKQRAVAAVWFAVAAVVPILFIGGTLGGSTKSITGLLYFFLPIMTAGFVGFALGFRILDPSAVGNSGIAALNGMFVSGLSFIVYIATVAGITVLSTPDPLSASWIGWFVTMLVFGAVFVGWLVLFVGAGSGLLLYRLSLVAGSNLRFSNIPNAVTPKDLAIFAAIIFGVFSPILVPRVVVPPVYRYLESESAKTERLSKEIIHAAQMGNADEIRSILAEGADPNSRHELTGQTPLSLVVPNGHKDAARVLLEAGADPNAAGVDEWTPLIWATNSVDPEMMQMLLQFGADANLPAGGTSNYTPLIKAALVNDIETVKYLLDHGAKINGRNQGGQTALTKAMEQRRIQSGMAWQRDHGYTSGLPEENLRLDDAIRSTDKMIEFLRQNGATE